MLIPLSGKHGAGLFAIIDEIDAAQSGHRWHLSSGYVKRGDYVNGKWRPVSLHRVITNAPPGVPVDHINGNELDNRRVNLRVCTPQVNSQNRHRKASGKSSSLLGVCFDSRASKWRATLISRGIYKHIGFYTTEEAAHIAYRAEREKRCTLMEQSR